MARHGAERYVASECSAFSHGQLLGSVTAKMVHCERVMDPTEWSALVTWQARQNNASKGGLAKNTRVSKVAKYGNSIKHKNHP
jgi:hypothetical protein